MGAPSRSLRRRRGPTSKSRLRETDLRLNQNQALALPSSEPCGALGLRASLQPDLKAPRHLVPALLQHHAAPRPLRSSHTDLLSLFLSHAEPLPASGPWSPLLPLPELLFLHILAWVAFSLYLDFSWNVSSSWRPSLVSYLSSCLLDSQHPVSVLMSSEHIILVQLPVITSSGIEVSLDQGTC